MILPIGTRVRSLRDPKIVGTVQGYGTLFPPQTILVVDTRPVVVYLVWHKGCVGSSALQPAVHVLDIHMTEEEIDGPINR